MKTHNLTGLLQSDNSIKEYANNVKWNGIDVYSQAEVSPTLGTHLKGTYITLDGTKTYGCVKDVPANTTLDASGIAEYLIDPQFPAGTKIWIDDGTGATAYTIGYGNTSVGNALDELNSNVVGNYLGVLTSLNDELTLPSNWRVCEIIGGTIQNNNFYAAFNGKTKSSIPNNGTLSILGQFVNSGNSVHEGQPIQRCALNINTSTNKITVGALNAIDAIYVYYF